MNRWAAPAARLGLLAVLGFALLALPGPARAAVDMEALAAKIADSLKANLTDSKFQTVAISRIRQEGGGGNLADLIDFSNVMLVRGRRFKVIDRSKLELILKEQQVQLQDFISTQKYKELGRLMGVDLFIYGTFYRDALVLKGIDVQNSAIVWADLFPLTERSQDSAYLYSLGKGTVASLDKDLDRLKKARIRLVSFWDFDTNNTFSPKSVMDYLSVALTKEGHLRVVDRENIRLITEEQQLNQAVFIDEQSAKRLGELYGVDGFIYGGIKRRPDGTYLASLKLMNVFNGVIEWADLIPMQDTPLGAALNGKGPAAPAAPPGMVLVPEGPFLMGSNDGQGIAAPQHRVNLYGFFIDETEVSNAEYQRFVDARHYRAPVGWQGHNFPGGAGDLPVVGVNWEDAKRYCEFAGKRLPSEEEWEKAARGSNGVAYPWGSDTFSPGFTVTRESGIKSAVPVQQQNRDVSPFNVHNMSGNVREWVADALHAYPGGSGMADSRFSKERVVRGGSWATTYENARTFFRGSSNPSLAWQDLGFRCARSENG
jgi:formylglycine-generating enzyme required for sulfatase activity/curli biogenesis system outer membrane secretion channel CsgG